MPSVAGLLHCMGFNGGIVLKSEFSSISSQARRGQSGAKKFPDSFPHSPAQVSLTSLHGPFSPVRELDEGHHSPFC